MKWFLFFLCMFSFSIQSEELSIPRFVSLKSNLINLRTGPGERFPIEWVYKRQGLPVEITDEFEHWRKIRDFEGTTGWVHKKMLSEKRTVITFPHHKTILFKTEKTTAQPRAYLDGLIILTVIKCEDSSIFCKVRLQDLTGYVKKDEVFGLYPNEEVKE